MRTYEFTLYLLGVDEATLDMADQLYAAGCDDATVGASEGVVHVEFMREASNLRDAIDSAIANVRKAGYEVARVGSEDWETINAINSAMQIAT
jgi:hypothetical protein